MKRIIRWKYFTVLAAAFVIFIFYFLYSKDKGYNKYKCETKKMKIRGVIDYISGRSSYRRAHVDNIKNAFSLNPAKLVYRKGFGEYHYYEIGDSLIKDADSKTVTIKRADSTVVFILDCDD